LPSVNGGGLQSYSFLPTATTTLAANTKYWLYAYGADSKIGTFSDALMAEAKKKGWIVISMKDDWKTIFPPER